jgi:histidinol dehydrogenase
MLHHSSKTFDKDLAALLRSGDTGDERVHEAVAAIITSVRKKGDRAVCAYIKRFDKLDCTPAMLRVSQKEITAAARSVSPGIRDAIRQAAHRIHAFHAGQMPGAFTVKTAEGSLQQLIRPIDSTAIYSPGGTTGYPSSILMCAIPARIAGVRRIVAAVPSRMEIDPAVACALRECKIEEVYRIGGAHAIAALAYGTETIPRVDKIVGPGNAYVASAKKQVYGTVDIDTIAGPSEVAVLADSSADARWIALDMLAQAEHGSGDESAVCVTESATLATRIRSHLVQEAAHSPKKALFDRLRTDALAIIVCTSRRKSMDTINAIAPEHLQIMTKDPARDLEGIRNAGAIFLGPYSPVALGDYYIGTNHVLPTGKAAAFSSALGVYSFVKHIPVARITQKGITSACAPAAALARSEEFEHHARSVEARTTS